jgi:hypothetical protein
MPPSGGEHEFQFPTKKSLQTSLEKPSLNESEYLKAWIPYPPG